MKRLKPGESSPPGLGSQGSASPGGGGGVGGLPPPGPTFLRERCRSLGAVSEAPGRGRAGPQGAACPSGTAPPLAATVPPPRGAGRGGQHGARARGPPRRPAPHSPANRRRQSTPRGQRLQTVASHWLSRASLTA